MSDKNQNQHGLLIPAGNTDKTTFHHQPSSQTSEEPTSSEYAWTPVPGYPNGRGAGAEEGQRNYSQSTGYTGF